MKNRCVYFEKTLTIDKQSSAIAKYCYYQIRNIGRIRSYISDDACQILVRSLVTSQLDYGSAFLYGVNITVIDRLQRVQNAAARMITRRRKHDHITPTPVALYWLPVQYRCQYKFCSTLSIRYMELLQPILVNLSPFIVHLELSALKIQRG